MKTTNETFKDIIACLIKAGAMPYTPMDDIRSVHFTALDGNTAEIYTYFDRNMEQQIHCGYKS
jgi:hypothetical protein